MKKTIVTAAFKALTVLVSSEKGSELSHVALSAKRHEKVLQNAFAALMSERLDDGESLTLEYLVPNMSRKAVDIAILGPSGAIAAVEVKAPMTNHDGVKSKTRKLEHFPNDATKLRQMKSQGTALTFELVGLFESYGINQGGNVEPPHGRTIKEYESQVSKRYRIKWPTRHDYRPAVGRAEVDRALVEEGFTRMRGWTRCQLPSVKRNAASYLDLALYEVG